jgi:hypothetical protein
MMGSCRGWTQVGIRLHFRGKRLVVIGFTVR